MIGRAFSHALCRCVVGRRCQGFVERLWYHLAGMQRPVEDPGCGSASDVASDIDGPTLASLGLVVTKDGVVFQDPAPPVPVETDADRVARWVCRVPALAGAV